MKTFKTRWFRRWAAKEGLVDKALVAAVNEVVNGLFEADLGGRVIKKRVALPGRGKRGSVRTLVAFRTDEGAFFIYGFAKNERANIGSKELQALKLLAAELLAYSPATLQKALRAGELIEVSDDG